MAMVPTLVLFVVISTMHAQADRVYWDKQSGYYQGDIVLKKTRNGILASQRWPNGVLPYEFSNRLNEDQKNMVLKAIKEIEDHTCIKFRPKSNDKDYVTIDIRYGCSSPVGMTGGQQYVSLQEPGCWYHGTVVHELLHAVGLWHEQSRYDRNDYIIVYLQNVARDMEYNFEMKFPNETDTYGIPYNFQSIMHYGADAFSKDPKELITIETKDPRMQFTIGQRETGTELDYEKVRRIYKCSGSYPTMPPPPKPIVPCQDTMKDCARLANECETAWWGPEQCRKTCGFCSPDCKDDYSDCAYYWKTCKTDTWVKNNCKKTCKICSLS